MPIIKEREYRQMQTPLAAMTQANRRLNSDFYIEGYAAMFNKPYILYEYDGIKYYEDIDRNALDGADIRDIIMQYDHEGKVLARISNNTLGIEANDTGLFVYADLSKSNAAKEMYEEITAGLVTKMSWAFTTLEDSYNNDTRTRTITKIKKIYDVSAVSIPANPDTEISARSFVDGVIDDEKRELLVLQKERLQLKIKLV